MVVTEVSQLQEFARWSGVLAKKDVVLRIPGITETRATELQSELSRHVGVCGCEEGAALVTLASLAYGVYLLFELGAEKGLVRSHVWVGLGVIAVAGAVGKIAGLLRHHLLLARVIRGFTDADSGLTGGSFK